MGLFSRGNSKPTLGMILAVVFLSFTPVSANASGYDSTQVFIYERCVQEYATWHPLCEKRKPKKITNPPKYDAVLLAAWKSCVRKNGWLISDLCPRPNTKARR